MPSGRRGEPKRWEGLETGPSLEGRRMPYQPFLPSQVHLWNWYEILELDNQASDSEGEGLLPRGSPRTSQLTRHIATMGFKKERMVIVVISFSGKQGPICWLDTSQSLLPPWGSGKRCY